MRGIAKIAAVVLLVAAVGVLGVLVYQSGYAAGAMHGGMAAAAAQAAQEGVAPGTGGPGIYGPWAYGWRPWGFGYGPGFGPFGFIAGLLFLFLLFGLFKAAVWGGFQRSGGIAGRGPWETRMREVHDEWHRRTDAAPPDQPSVQA